MIYKISASVRVECILLKISRSNILRFTYSYTYHQLVWNEYFPSAISSSSLSIMVPPPLGTPARALHTTKVRKWQYPYSQALSIAGPSLKKKNTRTQVNTEATSETMKMALPMGLRLQAPPRIALPPIAGTEDGKRMLGYFVANISDPGHQGTMETEADVM